MKNTFLCSFHYEEVNSKVVPTISTDFEIESLKREEAVNFYFCMERTMKMLDEMFCICADDGGLDNIYEI